MFDWTEMPLNNEPFYILNVFRYLLNKIEMQFAHITCISVNNLKPLIVYNQNLKNYMYELPE